MKPRITVVIEKGKDGMWVSSTPEVPGAFSQGKTRKEAREMVLDALNELMTARRTLGQA